MICTEFRLHNIYQRYRGRKCTLHIILSFSHPYLSFQTFVLVTAKGTHLVFNRNLTLVHGDIHVLQLQKKAWLHRALNIIRYPGTNPGEWVIVLVEIANCSALRNAWYCCV